MQLLMDDGERDLTLSKIPLFVSQMNGCTGWHRNIGHKVLHQSFFSVLFLAVLEPRVGHTIDVLSPFICPLSF